MPRRARNAAAQAAQARVGHAPPSAAKAASPFAALAALRRDAQQRPAERDGRRNTPVDGRQPDGPKPDSGHEPSSSGTLSIEDMELFRESNAEVRPLRDNGRSELERPRPEPIPRTRADNETTSSALRPRNHPDLLHAAYDDVTPLRDTGRVELDTPARHRARMRNAGPPAAADRITGMDASALPSNIDPDDPDAVFHHAMRGAQPIDTRNRVELERPAPAPTPIKREADERAALTESLAAPLSFEDRLDMGDEAAFLRTGLPRRVLSDLRRGRWVLQGQIDLHGLTRDEARDALGHFLTVSLQQGKRCIRVIHGKGLGSPGRVSILKQLSRGWLAQREEILAFCQAGPHDGGSGALLVLMRAQNATRD